MTHYTTANDHCWACGAVTGEPVRGLCFDCYTRLRQPGHLGHSLPDGPASAPPFVTRVLVEVPAVRQTGRF